MQWNETMIVIFESDLLGHQVELTFENVLNIAFIILKWIYLLRDGNM
jgi:hypothetical protein